MSELSPLQPGWVILHLKFHHFLAMDIYSQVIGTVHTPTCREAVLLSVPLRCCTALCRSAPGRCTVSRFRLPINPAALAAALHGSPSKVVGTSRVGPGASSASPAPLQGVWCAVKDTQQSAGVEGELAVTC